MGRGMVKNIVAKANLEASLIIFNRSVERSEVLQASLGGPDKLSIADSIEGAVSQSDIIFTSLAGDASVVEVIDKALGCPNGVKGKLFVETSTILPNTTNTLAEKVRCAGGEFVAAPVFGAPAMADNGKLVVVLAGCSAAVDRVIPYCNGIIGRATIDLRDREPGTATLLKVTGNTFVLSMVEALAEGHVFAEKTGLGPDVLHTFLEAMFPGPFAAYSTRMMGGDYMREQPLFSVDLARKDANHAVNLADEVGVDLQIVKVARAHLEELEKEAGPTGDLPGIYGVVRKESGLDFSNRK
jgi:3-hydroxyisobutyrate dehydrogenase-like beta-hydroxyacid dehydrogenase